MRFAVATAGSLIFPFAPHLGAEVYEMMTGRRVWEEPWPEADPALLARDEIQLVVQVNGKLIDRLPAPSTASQEELEELARGSDKLADAFGRRRNREDCDRARQARELRGAMSAPRDADSDRPAVAAIGGVLLIVSLWLDWYGRFSASPHSRCGTSCCWCSRSLTLAALAIALGPAAHAAAARNRARGGRRLAVIIVVQPGRSTIRRPGSTWTRARASGSASGGRC